MGLRPRTVRRLVLVAGLALLVLVGAAALFTIPKIQNARQLERFRRDGLIAHEEGHHPRAVQLLGRYARAMGEEPIDPAIRVALARSRAAWEVGDGGHLRSAIAIYREHLRLNPEDRQAAEELLGLFVRTGGWNEARDLAERLRPAEIAEAGAEDLAVLRYEAQARVALDPADPKLEQIEDRLLAAETPAFVDVWRAFALAESSQKPERAAAIVERYAEAAPDAIGSRVLRAIYGGRDLPSEDSIAEIARAVGLDPGTGAWESEPVLDDEELVRVLVRAFELAGRDAHVFAVLRTAAASDNKGDFARALARRRYWVGRYDELLEQPGETPAGTAVADVAGYQAMVRLVRGQPEEAETIRQSLAASEDDFRAQGWARAIAARAALDAGTPVDARAAISEAIERYSAEPMFHLILGDAQEALGRTADAVDSWKLASNLAEPVVWLEPGLRQVRTFLRTGRAPEAGEAAMDLARRSRGNPLAVVVLVQTDATLARLGVLGPGRISSSRDIARSLRDMDVFPEGRREEFTLIIATLEAAGGNADAARSEIEQLLATSQSDSIRAEAMAVDQRFGLGLSDQMGEQPLPESVSDPDLAARLALAHVANADDDRDERVRAGEALLASGIEKATPATRPVWLRARATFLDGVGDERAEAAWKAAVDAAPDNIQILTDAVGSEALGYDREFVEATINRIVTLTATQGRTLPANLRLARAKAMFGRTPTRQARDDAMAITRSVVVAEPQNIAARVMLANMLAFPCPPSVPADQRYSPNPAAAIEEYLAAARLIEGPEAFRYLFTAADLHLRGGNEPQARQLLLDIFERARNIPAYQERVALEVSRLSDMQTASRLLTELFESASGGVRVTVGLQLAQAWLTANEPRRAADILRQLVEAEEMNARQAADLAAKLRKVGLAEESDRLLADLGRFGIEPTEASLIRAQAAASFGDAAQAEAILSDLVGSQPEAVEGWLALIRLLVSQSKMEEAAATADQAIALHPDDEQLAYWRQMALGNPADAIRMITAQPDTDAGLRLAIERVEDYDRRRADMDRDQRLAEVAGLLQSFPNNAAVVKFVFRERFALQDDPNALASDTLAASRRFVGDEDVLRMAAEATSAAGRFQESLRVANEWRGRTRGSPLEPDLYAAQALQRLGEHARVVERLAPYLDSAVGRPEEGFSASIILLHSRSRLALGEDAAVRSLLEPLARASRRFRSTIWLELAAADVRQPQAASDWIRAAEQMGELESQAGLVQAWMRLAERFPARGEEFALNAAQAAGEAVDESTDDLALIETAARAFQLWASLVPEDQSSEPYSQAETLFVRAAGLAPENPAFRFFAAGAADRAGRPADAERHYRSLLGMPSADGLMAAAARNNLAGLLSRGTPSAAQLEEAKRLADEAVAFQPLPAFLGTRGWVNLGMNRPAEAIADFDRAAQADPASVEAWAGLAVARAANGEPEDSSRPALDRARQIAGGSPIDADLRARLRQAGVEW